MNAAPQLPRNSLFAVLSSIIVLVSVLVLGAYGAYIYAREHAEVTQLMQMRANESLARLSHTMAPFIESYAVNEYDKLVAHETPLMQHLSIVVRDFRVGGVTGVEAYTSGRIDGFK